MILLLTPLSHNKQLAQLHTSMHAHTQELLQFHWLFCTRAPDAGIRARAANVHKQSSFFFKIRR